MRGLQAMGRCPLQSQFLQILNMSYIIDQLEHGPPSHSPPAYLSNTLLPRPSALTGRTQQPSQAEILKSLGMFMGPLVSSCIDCGHLSFQLLLNNVFRNISIILNIKVDLSNHTVAFHLRLLTQDCKPLAIPSRSRRLLFSKFLASRFCSPHSQFKIAVSMQNGQLRILSPLYGLATEAYPSLSVLVGKLAKISQQHLEGLSIVINFARDLCMDGRMASLQEQQDESVRKLHYYSQFSTVAVNLTLDSTTSDEHTINRKHQKELESIAYLKNSFVPTRNYRGAVQLFELADFNAVRNDVLNFEVSMPQRDYISEKTAPPNMQKSKNPHENNFILNNIRLNKREQKPLKKLHSSNFTTIYLGEIEYWYVGSYNGQQEPMHNPLPPHRKYVVLKQQKKGQHKSRIAHEKMILTKIKDGTSMFLPKYYINIEQHKNQAEQELMVDYLNHPTLAEYITKNKETMSYQTMIYLAYIIAQALRYLQEYQIAHLDLKPANIMVCKQVMVKLIDFGESYHPEVKGHQPGFSVPYSAPQNYLHPEHYNHKNDVFSLGVIMHELFLSRFPFYFHDPRHREYVYRKASFSNYWLSSPEGNMSVGESTIFPIIQLLVGKCLSPNPLERPQLEWMVLILRNCLDYLY